MSCLLVEASRTMPHPIHQGHTHTTRVQLQADLDDSVTGEELVAAAVSMLQQADAILEGQTKVLTHNIKEWEQCEYLVGEYVKFLRRLENGPLDDKEDMAVYFDIQDQLSEKGFLPKQASKIKGHWVIPRNVPGGLVDSGSLKVPADENVASKEPSQSEVEKPSEVATTSPATEVQQSQQSETVVQPATTDASTSESNAPTAEPALAEQAAAPSA